MLSEVEGVSRAQALMAWYAKASLPERKDLWLLSSVRLKVEQIQLVRADQRFRSFKTRPQGA